MNEQAEKPGSAREPKIIKRYTNRKLYDTVESRYVTLDEIAEMIKAGLEVKIIDNRTKEDLTSVTLAQIIFEEEKKQSQMPLAVLREIIRRPGESLQGFIQKEVSPRVASLKEEAEQRLEKLLGREGREVPPAPEGGEGGEGASADAAGQMGGPAELLKASQKAWEDWQRRIDERVRLVVENVVGNLPALGRDMQQLNQRLESLEKKLDELEKKTPQG
ncbi:MAG TPA: polyhydroxyalkanoate synthesis regulator DNA-binding domain-containing protein [Myxococcaceae bacterium]|nr:polyhydroxyalkanoate synthesis regulator DNA-binding domain-containing protein [Myxococcaceae bacterium]